MGDEKKEKGYDKEDMNKCCEKYAEIKEARPQGKQWLPIQQGLKKLALDGEKPEDVIGCMDYLENELGYNDWTIQTVWKKMADYKGWKKKQEKSEQERKERKVSFDNGPSVEEVEDFLESFKNWKNKSAHGDSPWAFEYYLDDVGVISFREKESGWRKETVHDIERYQKAWELYEKAKSYEDEQMEAEKVEEHLEELFDKYEVGKKLPD